MGKGCAVKAITDDEEFVFYRIANYKAWILSNNPSYPFSGGANAVIAGARSHDGLSLGDYIAFHQGCGTEVFIPASKLRFTTTAIRHLFINEEQIF
ncbi:MAG: hypothetical protein NVSMB39_0030 [Candidatus Saccharimonadales bacterium]